MLLLYFDTYRRYGDRRYEPCTAGRRCFTIQHDLGCTETLYSKLVRVDALRRQQAKEVCIFYHVCDPVHYSDRGRAVCALDGWLGPVTAEGDLPAARSRTG